MFETWVIHPAMRVTLHEAARALLHEDDPMDFLAIMTAGT
ncbi:hypothetical protein SFOMI_4763 [Sphingobium fuliginis]|jgi:hypothetical protein|uniref:Uncharacterized protein n=1 Tax=Sphingobium fuliginis (strain ATCC 27551) TaxID=336203 RepID=A0A292ZMS9_SPHSA|nr:hypothetical protein SFOMI_4763 [Sphingobium fuliginis]